MPKSYRIRTTPGSDKSIKIELEQDFEFLEILSLKINQGDIYSRMCADYGVIIGRVLVNNGYGLPNARVSVFIPIEDADLENPIISELYPYKSISDVNEDGYRYNLLPKEPSYVGHAATGTFPTKNEVLTDESYVEVYDKYYKFSVRTNDSGDYMIFGVPTGTQTLLMDVDLSDIGCFSLSPQDLITAGLGVESQVNGSSFKTSTNLNELPQIVSLNKIIEVAPLWGEPEICLLGITRADFDLTASANITIKPTSVFMGSLVSTTDDDSVKVSCKPKNSTGNLCELVSGPGQILSIRQTIEVDQYGRPILEVHELEENGKVIDSDGVFLINVPMNLNYIVTNEFGEQVLSDDQTKGIPTKGKYRFKFKWQNEQGLQNPFMRGNYLVPNIKEYGWTNSTLDPLHQSSTGIQLTIQPLPQPPVGTINIFLSTGGLVLDNQVNISSFSVLLNGLPYFGDVTSIPINTVPMIVTISPLLIDVTSAGVLDFVFYQQDTFDALRSYAFSLDWDDYVDPQEAINCDDTFYEFNYNKVYTTAMFLDRFKYGAGRARHLGIKEIDDRACKTTVNTFPTNDIIRNFDLIFFLFNLLLNILIIPLLVLLWVAHFAAFVWRVLKYMLIFYALYLGFNAIVIATQATLTVIQASSTFSIPGGPVISVGLILSIVYSYFVATIKLALSITFAYFVNKYINSNLNNFPRLGLPMISSPECTTCDCECNNANIDDVTIDSVQQGINDTVSSLGSSSEFAQSTSFLAPLNLPGTYDVEHPNFKIRPNYDVDDSGNGYFDCGDQYLSLTYSVSQNDIESSVIVKSILDFKRLFSGYDVLTGFHEYEKFHAPQPFLFAGDKSSGNDDRWFGYPTKETFPQKLNEFNTRDKYFNNIGSGANQVKITVNPQLSLPPYNLGTQQSYNDQIIVLLVRPGTAAQIGVGNLMTFQDPNYTQPNSLVSRRINLTGGTINQFNNGAVTGTTQLSSFPIGATIPTPISKIVNYANPASPTSPQLTTTINIIQTGYTQTNAIQQDDFLKYDTDMEYFQLITGLTVNDFYGLDDVTNTNLFPAKYLRHQIQYVITDPCSVSNSNPNQSVAYYLPTLVGNPPVQANNYVAIEHVSDYKNYEIIFVVKGVDPHTSKQKISYDLSRIFGYNYNQPGLTITGNYFLNVPIQSTGSVLPKSHNTTTNTSPNLYFPSYTFSISPAIPGNQNYTAFTSNLPYYYLSTDDTSLNTFSEGGLFYKPVPNFPIISSLGTNAINSSNDFTLPRQQPDYIVGGTFIAANFNAPYNGISYYNAVSAINQYGYPLPTLFDIFSLYSPAYYRYTNPAASGGVNFNDRSNLIMRSDRLPTSTCVENGFGSRTGFALFQNNNFCYFTSKGLGSVPTFSFASSYEIYELFDQYSGTTSLTETLTCENIVPLSSYSGSGTNVGVLPVSQWSIPEDRVVKGCYCLLNKDNDPNESTHYYLINGAYSDDARLLLEWKTRFTLVFASCRGVFAQVFQNNWINGTLYMPSFNKRSIYPLPNISSPTYLYCKDMVVYNNISNNFYYRSSPWSQNVQQFIGKKIDQPLNWFGINAGYNDKQILFPTTVVDMGPRDSFVTEICGNPNFKGYMTNQFQSTSYNENSDLIQIGFLSRLLNENIRQAMIPITVNGSSSEGKGVSQFFNSNRGGERIDGDFAQALSINSEFKINPYIDENYANNEIYIGDDGQLPFPYKPIFGIFYKSNDPEYRTRRKFSPGIEIYNTSPLIQDSFGYPTTQDVPMYRWKLEASSVIFGSEDNNWYTTTSFSGGFTVKGYQNLDFSSDPYFISNTLIPGNQLPNVPQGFITNFDVNGNPLPSNSNVLNNNVLVGGPNHFYFGLNNGKTAINRFIKKYINTTEE